MEMDVDFFRLWLGVFVGVVAFFGGFVVRMKRRMVENIPTSTVRAIALGPVEIKGIARPYQTTLVSPFSQIECVLYHFEFDNGRVRRRERLSDGGEQAPIASETSKEWFYVEDETGKVLVDPMGAEFIVKKGVKYPRDRMLTEEKLEKAGMSWLGAEREIQCDELYICPGDTVYVMGMAVANPNTRFSRQGTDNICIRQRGPLFCISDMSEKELSFFLKNLLYSSLYGGPVLTVVCLFILIGHYFKQMF